MQIVESRFENLFQTFSRSLFGFGFLRRSTAYVPIGVLTRLYRFHPWNRTTYIRVGVPLQFFLLQDLALILLIHPLLPCLVYARSILR